MKWMGAHAVSWVFDFVLLGGDLSASFEEASTKDCTKEMIPHVQLFGNWKGSLCTVNANIMRSSSSPLAQARDDDSWGFLFLLDKWKKEKVHLSWKETITTTQLVT